MRLFGHRAPPLQDASPSYRPTPLRVLRADGQRIDLSKRDAGQLLVATRQSWQTQAWAYRDLIGELRYAIRLLSRSVARVRFYAAETRPWPDDPVPLDGTDHSLDKQLAADAVHNFARLPLDSNPDGFTARLVENLSVAGEGWVHIGVDDRFYVRSTSEIAASPDGSVMLTTLPATVHGSRRTIDPQREDLLRCWVPHPEWGQLADSPLRCLLDVCEDVVLAGREQRAAARSRVAANGILLMPSTLSLVRSRAEDDEDDDSVTSDTFMTDFTAAMLASIRDDGDAQAVVPIVIRGEPEDLDKVRHVVLQRADSGALIERQSAAILRVLKGLDVQPEQVEGTGEISHWGQWFIEAQSVKHQVQPMGETAGACLAQAFLRPALLSLDHNPTQVARVIIAADVSPLAENPNRGQDARDAHTALVIKDATLRTALGFGDDDKPDEDEVARRIAAKQGLPPEVAAGVLELTQYMRQAQGGRQVIELPARPAELPSGQRPVAQPGQVSPDRPVPDTSNAPPGVVAAAATPGGDIDSVLVERITVAADAAVARVLERAGNRLRSAAQRDRAVTAELAKVESHLIPAHLGRARTESFVSIADLLALSDGYPRLRGQVTQWLAEASGRGDRVAVQSQTDLVWKELAVVLDVAVERALFSPVDSGGMLIHPSGVRRALGHEPEGAP